MAFELDPTTAFGQRAEQRLREDRLAWLTTTSADGTPQPVPVWFLWDGERSFLLYSKPGTAKLRNLASRPRVSLHLNGDDVGGEIVVALGDAALADEPPADQNAAYLQKYAALIERNGWTPASFASDYSVAMRITATTLRGW